MMTSSPQYTHAILDLCKVHTLETTTMMDYQFANVLLALLDLMITLHINCRTSTAAPLHRQIEASAVPSVIAPPASAFKVGRWWDTFKSGIVVDEE